MTKRFIMVLVFILGLFIPTTGGVLAQDEGYRVRVRKDFGYGWANEIQGRFTISLYGDETLVQQVTYFVDDQILGTVTDAPFKYQFQTKDFEPGSHRLSAEVQLQDGSTQETNAVVYEFLASKAANQQVTKLLLFIGGATLAVFVLGALIQSFLTKKNKPKEWKPGEPRNYGFFGGTICPRCGHSFPRHIFGMNLVVGRLDRCDHCGKWVMTTRATPSALRAAEEAEREAFIEEENGALEVPDLKENLEDTIYYDDI
jgi:hypothetical protein